MATPRRRAAQADAPHRTFVYTSDSQDFVQSHDQHFRLPDDWVWYHGNSLRHRLAYQLTFLVADLVSRAYLRFWLHARIIGKGKLRTCGRHPYFVYANHTQPFGDITLTVRMNWPHRTSAVVATANMGIPVIGRILHHFDFLAVPKTDPQRRDYKKAMTQLVHDGVSFQIYPEAHVWPYDTRIRPFTDTSMRYPVRFHTPSFTATTTYQHARFGSRPKATVYIDGPFFPRVRGSEEECKHDLWEQIRAAMIERSKASTYDYYSYRRADTPAPRTSPHTTSGEETA